MIIRVLIAGFASSVASISYLTGLTRITTALLLGFGVLFSLLFGLLFLLPPDKEHLWFPVYSPAPSYPFFLLALLLVLMVIVLFLARPKFEVVEQVSGTHFKYLLAGLAGYISTLFLSSLFWFPSDARALTVGESRLAAEALAGTCFFIAGLSVSLYLLYRASRGSSEERPDLMRRFVLAVFAFFQLDKMPALVAYLLVYSPDAMQVYPHLPALALSSYIPVGIFLLKTTWDSRQG
ncbi:MAG: hypothetical protein JRJ68_01855 [Deltaproteobacteria bacterium]|nr:hypothetical protein [Deltaproteobacteria bacterium]